MITDKVHQLTIDRKPESEQLNYIDKPQRSHSPKPNVQAGPIDSQRGRYDDPVRKVRFSQRLHSNNTVRTGNGFHKDEIVPVLLLVDTKSADLDILVIIDHSRGVLSSEAA